MRSQLTRLERRFTMVAMCWMRCLGVLVAVFLPACGAEPEVGEIEIPASTWQAVRSTSEFPSLSSDVWSFDPSASNEIAARVQIPPDAEVAALTIRINRNNPLHPSVGDFVVRIHTDDIVATSQIAVLGQDMGASWISIDVIPLLRKPVVTSSGQVQVAIASENFIGRGDPSPLFASAVLLYSK